MVELETNHHDEWLNVASVRQPAPRSLYGVDGDTQVITAVKGGGSLTAFETRSLRSTTIRRLGSRGPSVLANDSGRLLDARGTTLAVLSGKRTVRVSDTAKRRRWWRLTLRADLSSAAVDGRGAIAVHVGNRLQTVTPEARRQPARESTALPEHATIAGFAEGIVAALDGRTITVVRPTDGRHTRLTPPGRGIVQASLSDAGLFFSYSSDTRSGRVTFVPRELLLRRLR
jgi:hypothetical protein